VIYKNGRASFCDRLSVLGKGPLAERGVDKKELASILDEYM
jgi:hypothetical protein